MNKQSGHEWPTLLPMVMRYLWNAECVISCLDSTTSLMSGSLPHRHLFQHNTVQNVLDDVAEAGTGRTLPVVECDGAAREVARDEGQRGAQRGGHLIHVVVRVHRRHRGLHSFTFRLNLSALYGIGGARGGCVAHIKGGVGGV